jgi:hypothetical protein
MLSVVTVSRNDDHGGNPAERTQRHIDCLYQQANNFQREIEYIMVEWNPPVDRPPITEAVDFHTPTKYWHPRIITVPPDIHYTFKHSGKLPLFQMIGKNVGIRRANGNYILVTNVDILIDIHTFLYITEESNLQPGTSYRVDRIDIEPNIPVVHPDYMLQWCDTHILRRNAKYAVQIMNGGTPLYRRIASRYYHTLKRHAANVIFRIPNIHLMGNGDFHLMHRDDWMGLMGYAELEMYSPHIDGLLLLAAHYSGIQEQYLPYPNFKIYHVEHPMGMTPENMPALFRSIDARGIPRLPLSVIVAVNDEMRHGGYKNGMYQKRGQYWTFKDNTPGWGLVGYRLPEVCG